MKQKFQNLGLVLSRDAQKKLVGGCGSAGHCYSAYWSNLSGCLTSGSTFNPENNESPYGVIFTSGCNESIKSAFFNCWNNAIIFLINYLSQGTD